MQIGLAKTPTMHGGIGSAEVGFTQCTFFFLTALAPRHTYACNALPLTFTPSPCISLSRTGNTHTNSQRKGQREREREVCVISVWFDSSHAGLSCPLLDSGVHRVEKKKVPEVERGMTRAVYRGGEDANQERKFWVLPVALLLMAAGGNVLHADSFNNWLTAILSRMHACAYANVPVLKPYPHTHT